MNEQEQRRCKHCGRMLTKMVIWTDRVGWAPFGGLTDHWTTTFSVDHIHAPEEEPSQPAAGVTTTSAGEE